MYSVTFIKENGESILIGADNGIVADFDFGKAVNVNIGTTQGFGQIGESVETQSVKGRKVSVKGAIFGNVQEKKKRLRRMFAPFTKGKLVVDGYELGVTVANPPTFSEVRNDGRFTMQLFAPYPYFKNQNKKVILLGEIKPMFKFPVNYAKPHKFGERSKGKTITLYNDSDINIPLSVTLIFDGAGSNITISNLKTFETLKINGSYNSGDIIELYRDDFNFLHCDLKQGGKITDILGRIDEESNLYYLQAGDNLVSASDEGGVNNFTAYFIYKEEVVAWYED